MTARRECIDGFHPEAGCAGPVELRECLSGTGEPIPRCDEHWFQRLDREAELRRRYPVHAPADFDSMAAGERWGEDDPWP